MGQAPSHSERIAERVDARCGDASAFTGSKTFEVGAGQRMSVVFPDVASTAAAGRLEVLTALQDGQKLTLDGTTGGAASSVRVSEHAMSCALTTDRACHSFKGPDGKTQTVVCDGSPKYEMICARLEAAPEPAQTAANDASTSGTHRRS